MTTQQTMSPAGKFSLIALDETTQTSTFISFSLIPTFPFFSRQLFIHHHRVLDCLCPVGNILSQKAQPTDAQWYTDLVTSITDILKCATTYIRHTSTRSRLYSFPTESYSKFYVSALWDVWYSDLPTSKLLHKLRVQPSCQFRAV